MGDKSVAFFIIHNGGSMYIEINDGLIENVNRWALQRGLSLTDGLETALQIFLSGEQKQPFRLRKASFKGEGLHPNITEHDIKQIIYKEHQE